MLAPFTGPVPCRLRSCLAFAAALVVTLTSVAALEATVALPAAAAPPAPILALAGTPGRSEPAARANARAVAQASAQAGAQAPLRAPLAPPIAHPGPGYWLVGADGGVFPFGRGAYAGSLASKATNAPVVGESVTATGLGYWLAAADGGVFAFGDAGWHGSLPATALSVPVVGMAAPPTGGGYWLTDASGGVFAFGDAHFLGSRGGKPLSAGVAAIASTPSGNGYWLVGRDGAVYAYGDAPYLGGVGGQHIEGAIAGIAVTTTGHGYWLVGVDGGVYAFGDATYIGGLSGRPHAPIVSIARSPRGVGYWLAGSDGGVFGFGSAAYLGSVGASRLNRGIVGIASGDGTAIPRVPTAPASSAGFDISWPQCDGIRPAPPYGFGVVGVTDGHLFSANPCLAQQWNWATDAGSFAAVYVNTNAPTANEYARLAAHEAWACGANSGCVLDTWGRKGVRQALHDAGAIAAPLWWLDVETGNEWLPDTAANAVVLRAMVDELQKAGKRVGVYSTSFQWAKIAGSYAPGLPLWVPGAPAHDAQSFCDGHAFAGGVTWMTQSGDADFDTDVLCGAGLANFRLAFATPRPFAVLQYDAPVAGEGEPAPGGNPLENAIDALGRDARNVLGVAVEAAGGRAGHHGLGWTGWLLVVAVVGAVGCAGRAGGRRVGVALLGTSPCARAAPWDAPVAPPPAGPGTDSSAWPPEGG